MRAISELAGESLREIGVLLIVFVPSDAVFYQGELKLATIACFALLILVGLALVGAGIFLERGLTMGLVIPLAMFGVAVGVIFFWGLHDKRKRRAANGDARPHRAA